MEDCPLTWVLAQHTRGFGMQTTLALALDLLTAAAAPDGTRRDFRAGAVSVLRDGVAVPSPATGTSPENAAVPEIVGVLSRCLGSEDPAELPHLLTGVFRTVFEFVSPDSGQPCPTAALLYERITRAADRTLEPGWRERAQERLAGEVAQWHSETSPSPSRPAHCRIRVRVTAVALGLLTLGVAAAAVASVTGERSGSGPGSATGSVGTAAMSPVPVSATLPVVPGVPGVPGVPVLPAGPEQLVQPTAVSDSSAALPDRDNRHERDAPPDRRPADPSAAAPFVEPFAEPRASIVSLAYAPGSDSAAATVVVTAGSARPIVVTLTYSGSLSAAAAGDRTPVTHTFHLAGQTSYTLHDTIAARQFCGSPYWGLAVSPSSDMRTAPVYRGLRSTSCRPEA